MYRTVGFLFSACCVALFRVLTMLNQAHPDLPEGKAIIAQNLSIYYSSLTRDSLVRSEVLPSGGFRWAALCSLQHLLCFTHCNNIFLFTNINGPSKTSAPLRYATAIYKTSLRMLAD